MNKVDEKNLQENIDTINKIANNDLGNANANFTH